MINLLTDQVDWRGTLINMIYYLLYQIYEPTVFENYVHDIWIDNQQIELSLWDTAGKLNEITPYY